MTRQGRVLLVDDDRDVRNATSLRLPAAGYETLTARDGKEAVSSAIQNRPDAIVLDVRMPGMDGLAALGEIRRRDDIRQTPIVMLSASLRDQQAALDAGARFFLTKPYQGKTLVAAVGSAISERTKAVKATDHSSDLEQ